MAHSCGHDIHMASWVGTAKTLVGLKDRWHGTLMLIAQPAEEIKIIKGAKAVINDPGVVATAERMLGVRRQVQAIAARHAQRR